MVYTGQTELATEALEWLDILNPFKGPNNLIPLYEFIASQNSAVSPSKKKTEKPKTSSFLLKGDIWELQYVNHSVSLKSAKGYFDIQKLLQNPHQEFHSLELMGSGLNENVSTSSIDGKAKQQYMHRIKDLQSEIDEAEDMNQIEKSRSLREEYDLILDHLSQSMGLDGKTRKIGSNAEKARSAVTWRIRNTIKKIQKEHPELGKHRSTSIKTGTFCSYQPELDTNWIV